MNTSQSASLDSLEHADARRHEILGVVSGALTLLFVLALLSFDTNRPEENWVGLFGNALTSFLGKALGWGAWIVPIEGAFLTFRLFQKRSSSLGIAVWAATLVIIFMGCGLLHLSLSPRIAFGSYMPGGLVGEVLAEVARALIGTAGAYIVFLSVLVVTFILRTPLSIAEQGRIVRGLGQSVWRKISSLGYNIREAWREAKNLEAEHLEDEDSEIEDEDGPHIVPPSVGQTSIKRQASIKNKAKKKQIEGEENDLNPNEMEGDEEAFEQEHEDAETDQSLTLKANIQSPKKKKEKGGPKIVAPKPTNLSTNKDLQGSVTVEETPAAPDYENFQLPPTSLLMEAPPTQIQIDEETLKENAARLVEKLEAYGVKGRVDEIHPGPVVTMYEFEPQSGTKLSKIAGLADDLAMALAAQKVRIVAPIPGKARVGFELPNENRQTVYLRSILEDKKWGRMNAALPVAFGQDIAGQPIFGDLAKMPHMLVAGATGQGKSVGINVMLASLLMKKTPDEVRLLMIDPKVVELAVFDGIPHMLLPVVTDMKKAARALKWAVDEMERRYQLFADAGARNIVTYNQKVEKVLNGQMPIEKLIPKKAEVLTEDTVGEDPKPPADPTKLPYIVVVVDEFADLMMVAAKDVEACVARLAQKARAAGIHVILATQRPSVDVITGMIKANFPSRMAFKVSQREDSKTILGRNGAEHLLGRGDMLMIPPGSSDLQRIHGALIQEDEVRDVCDNLREQGAPIYDDDILKPREDEDEQGAPASNSDDPLYDRAVAVVADAGYCSISHLQRKFSIGYNKAAKLVEKMEEEGVVGPPSGKAGGRREVFAQPQ